jgi:hypothetical protein
MIMPAAQVRCRLTKNSDAGKVLVGLSAFNENIQLFVQLFALGFVRGVVLLRLTSDAGYKVCQQGSDDDDDDINLRLRGMVTRPPEGYWDVLS